MRGRKPKPTALKLLQGTARDDRRRNEPAPESSIPQCPDHLDPEARVEWNRLAAELHALGILTRIDRAVLAAYCQTWSRWSTAERKIAEQGTIVKSPNGYPIVNPYLSVANEALRQLRAFATELGLSPSSRSRVNITASPAQPNGVAKRVR